MSISTAVDVLTSQVTMTLTEVCQATLYSIASHALLLPCIIPVLKLVSASCNSVASSHPVVPPPSHLPDALVVPAAIQAKALAYKVHSDLGDGFIRGVDGRSRRVVGAEHELQDGDVLKIHAKS